MLRPGDGDASLPPSLRIGDGDSSLPHLVGVDHSRVVLFRLPGEIISKRALASVVVVVAVLALMVMVKAGATEQAAAGTNP